MEKLILFGMEYEVSDARVVYNNYRASFYNEAKKAKEKLYEYFKSAEPSGRADFDKVVDSGRSMINNALVITVKLLTEKELYEYSVDSIKRICVEPLTKFEDAAAAVYNQLDNIDMALRREEAARQQEIDSASSSWSGGGFGLAGALKGAATAAALNAASGAVTKALTSGDAKRAKSAHEMKIYNLLNGSETVRELCTALYDDIFCLIKTYVKILTEDKNENIGVVTDEEIIKSNDIFTNIKSGIYEDKPEVERQMWIKLFMLYPYDINYYVHLLKVHKEVFDEAKKLVEWYNMPMVELADTLLFEKYSFADITELEAAQNQKELIVAELEKFGVTESNLTYIADGKIEEILVQRRIYDEILYETEEDCEYAKVLDMKLQETIDATDRNSLEDLAALYLDIINGEDVDKYILICHKKAFTLHEPLLSAIKSCTSAEELSLYKEKFEAAKNTEISVPLIRQIDSKIKSINMIGNLNESKDKMVGAAKGLLGKAKGIFKK